MNKDSLITDYIEQVGTTLSQLTIDKIERMVEILHKARAERRRVHIFGNGGSAATASHFVCDLNKCAICSG